jgi:hypothetical protein
LLRRLWYYGPVISVTSTAVANPVSIAIPVVKYMSAVFGKGKTFDLGFVPASRASLLDLQIIEARKERDHFGGPGGNERDWKCARREAAIWKCS